VLLYIELHVRIGIRANQVVDVAVIRSKVGNGVDLSRNRADSNVAIVSVLGEHPILGISVKILFDSGDQRVVGERMD